MKPSHVARVRTCLLLAVGLSALSACTPTMRPKRRTTAVNANVTRPVEVKNAVAAISKETCHRETRCSRIGEGRQFVTEGDCEKTIETDMRQILNTSACETGYVESDSLVECLTSIRASDCRTTQNSYCQTPRICSP